MVELIVIITVLGILVAIAVPQYQGFRQRANDTERKTDLTSVSAQLEYYYGRYGGYPTLANLNDATFRQGNKISSGDNDNLLADPKNRTLTTLQSTTTPNNNYSYIPAPSGCTSPSNSSGTSIVAATPCRSYRLIGRLEDLADPDKDPTASTASVAYYIKYNAANN